MTLVVSGDYSDNGKTVYVGREYVTDIELSEQFYRDQDGTVIDGSLSLRTMRTRHHQTGDYDLFVFRRNRPDVAIATVAAAIASGGADAYLDHVTSFRASTKGTSLLHDGEVVGRVLGYSNVVSLHLLSSYPTPFNVTDIEIHGIFRTRSTSHF